jgi:2-polyprenyl-3-methyl-5-hydroxy-6-metoxy-1,4-benzoquinol methylase
MTIIVRTNTPTPTAIHLPHTPVQHRDEEYEEGGFETLLDMQERHFWYRGRHRFLLEAVDRYLLAHPRGQAQVATQPFAAIDLGGGTGGWVRYLAQQRPGRFASLALADSSLMALTMAELVLPSGTERYQIDLMQLHMRDQWDAAFLLDVIEHLPDDTQVLRQSREALKPGGYLFVTTPAFQQFWSYNDVMVHHLRRYRCRDFARLAQQAGLRLCDARYFMFLLSPLYLLSRLNPGVAKMSEAKKKALAIKQHGVPTAPVNAALSAVFAAETPLGHWLRFPWGTSILGVFQKV